MSAEPDYDPVLKMFVQISTGMADDTQGQAELGITLNVGGFLVSGYVTSARQFMLGNPFSDHIVEVAEAGCERGKADIFSDDSLDYIHLRGAKFFLPGQPAIPVAVEGVFWRGRLSEVSGFTFGVLSPPPTDENA